MWRCHSLLAFTYCRHVSSFKVWTIMNKTVINICMKISVHSIHLSHLHEFQGEKMLNCMRIFNFKETAKANFQSCCIETIPIELAKISFRFSNRCWKTELTFLWHYASLCISFCFNFFSCVDVILLFCCCCFVCFIYLFFAWPYLGVLLNCDNSTGILSCQMHNHLKITLFRF